MEQKKLKFKVKFIHLFIIPCINVVFELKIWMLNLYMHLWTQFICSGDISLDFPDSLSFKFVFLLLVVLYMVHLDMFPKDIMRINV